MEKSSHRLLAVYLLHPSSSHLWQLTTFLSPPVWRWEKRSVIPFKLRLSWQPHFFCSLLLFVQFSKIYLLQAWQSLMQDSWPWFLLVYFTIPRSLCFIRQFLGNHGRWFCFVIRLWCRNISCIVTRIWTYQFLTNIFQSCNINISKTMCITAHRHQSHTDAYAFIFPNKYFFLSHIIYVYSHGRFRYFSLPGLQLTPSHTSFLLCIYS